MTASTAPSPRGSGARVRALLALDGPIATLLLTTFQFFLVSVSFVGCLVPALLFTALVGWQSTHLAVWLGALSLLPLAPAVYALLRSARRLLIDRSDAHAAREFWISFAHGCRTLAWAAIAVCVLAVLLGYDLALFGASGAMALLIACAAAASAALLIAVCAVAAARDDHHAVELLTAAVKAIARRPHVALSWLLLTVIGVVALAVPVIGPPLALFLPALLGVGIHICNDALRLSLNDETRPTP
jgi:hypothetical protein